MTDQERIAALEERVEQLEKPKCVKCGQFAGAGTYRLGSGSIAYFCELCSADAFAYLAK